MNSQETLVYLTKKAIDMLFRTVSAMPEDKLVWKPAETSRSAKELLDEILLTTLGTADLLKNGSWVDRAEAVDPKTVADYEKIIKEDAEVLYAAILALPDEKLMETIELPWGTNTYLESAAYPYWNTMYHLGQISYIQTMYGDTDMY